MIKKITFILFLPFIVNADIISYYKLALKSIKYDKTYSLYKHSNQLSQNGITYSKYTNFSFDLSYLNTKAKKLNNSFNTTNIIVSNTLDLFGKKTYQIQLLALDIKAKKSLLDIQKEHFFISLVEMVALYQTKNLLLTLNQKLYNTQIEIYNKLKKLNLNGIISTLDLLRFKNSLTSLQRKIVMQNNEVKKMKAQLNI